MSRKFNNFVENLKEKIMKNAIIIFLAILPFFISAQEKINRKGTYYAYWGWNRGYYTKSDITFTGRNYEFELKDVVAKDRQSPFDFRTYFSPTKLSIPQYNFRFGYFLTEKYSLSIGADHMKYVMVSNQMSTINGKIENSGTAYDGTYENQAFQIKPDFLLFEHTDGLNYENIELRRHDELFARKNINISFFEGFGVGLLVPRTNTTLLNYKRYDEFHVAGFGLGAVGGLNFEFFNHFFLQAEAKFGFCGMPDIRTTEFKSDRAKQHFFFSQFNGLFGWRFKFKKEEKVMK